DGFRDCHRMSPICHFRASTVSADYLVPYVLGNGSSLFGEAHVDLHSFSLDSSGSPNNSLGICLGKGYRNILGQHALLGVHSFQPDVEANFT
ncbi:MAG: hypothetical protein PHS86_13140, partial [Syntrophaceae bacterium]|nr:hypothetical protein [Syntrophaceae bacterium]